ADGGIGEFDVPKCVARLVVGLAGSRPRGMSRCPECADRHSFLGKRRTRRHVTHGMRQQGRACEVHCTREGAASRTGYVRASWDRIDVRFRRAAHAQACNTWQEQRRWQAKDMKEGAASLTRYLRIDS